MNSYRSLYRASAFAVAAFVSLFAGAATWFDAGVSGYEDWPSDGSDLVVQGAGTWSGTASASLFAGADGSRIGVDAAADSPLGFTAAWRRALPTTGRP